MEHPMTTTEPKPNTTVLSTHNAHPRDEHILFFEEGHKYQILCDPDHTYTSVTTFIHQHFEGFNADAIIDKMTNGRNWKEGHKYWGMTPDQIKAQWEELRDAASTAGTAMHYAIECFHNRADLEYPYTYRDLLQPALSDDSTEWQHFLEFVADHPRFKPYRTEWTIFDDEAKLAGSIDMVYENPDGTLSIYDWKRAKEIMQSNGFNKFATSPDICHLPDTNYWHYALQLNLYKYILETHYGKVVKDLWLVRLHPNAKRYEQYMMPLLETEVTDLIRTRTMGLPIKI